MSVWYEEHSTPNPLGIKPPDSVKIIKGNKFKQVKQPLFHWTVIKIPKIIDTNLCSTYSYHTKAQNLNRSFPPTAAQSLQPNHLRIHKNYEFPLVPLCFHTSRHFLSSAYLKFWSKTPCSWWKANFFSAHFFINCHYKPAKCLLILQLKWMHCAWKHVIWLGHETYLNIDGWFELEKDFFTSF